MAIEAFGGTGASVDGGIPLTFSLALLVFSIGFAITQILRPRMPDFFYPRIWSPGDKPPLTLSFANFSWIPRALITKRDEVAIRAGMYALLYLRFQLYMFVYLIFMAILALPILLPINIVGGASEFGGFVSTTITNVPNGSSLMAAHTLLAVIFILVGLLLIWLYQRSYFDSRKGFKTRDFVNSHTVFIRGLTRKVVTGAELYNFMDMLYPEKVVSAHLGFNANELVALKLKKQNLLNELARDEFVFHKTGERRLRSPGTCGCCATSLHLRAKEDSLSYNKAAIAKVSGQISRMQQQTQKTTGVAFVTFESAQVAHEMRRDFRFYRRKKLSTCSDQELVKYMKARSWVVKQATKPKKRLENHYKIGPKQKLFRRFLVTSFLVVIALLWSFVWSFLASASTLADIPGLGIVITAVIDFNPFFQDLIESWLPSLLTSLFVACLPWILIRFCVLEGWDTQEELETSVMIHYFVFVVLNVIVFPSLLIGTFDSLALIFGGDVDSVLGNINYALQGAFYINYVVQQTFLSGVIRLLRAHKLFIRWFKLYFAVTDEEKQTIIKENIDFFEYRVRFAQTMFTLICVLVYCIEAPLIIPAGILNLVVLHVIDKNNVLHVFPKNVDADSNMIPTVINFFLIGIMLQEAFLMICFWFKEFLPGFIVIAVLAGLTLLFTLLLNILNWYNKYRYLKYGQPSLIDWDIPQDILRDAYMHSGMVVEEKDLKERIEDYIQRGNGEDLKKDFQSNYEKIEAEFDRLNQEGSSGASVTPEGAGEEVFEMDDDHLYTTVGDDEREVE